MFKRLLGKKRAKTSDRTKKLRQKLKKRPHFANQKPQGLVIYQNPNAVPVESVIGRKATRRPFKLENVEWISMRTEKKIGQGGFGTVYWGKIKFKGVSSSQRVVLKDYALSARFVSEEVLKRLEKSGVSHPKMVLLPKSLAGFSNFIVMEPFIRKKDGKIVSKFRPEEADLIANLDFRKRSDRKLFKQALNYTAMLARAGLSIKPTINTGLKQVVDIFTTLKLRGGQRKLFVQGLDTLIVNETPSFAWKTSTFSLLLTVSNVRSNSEKARALIIKATKKEGFT